MKQNLPLDPECPPPRPYGRRTAVGAPRRCRICRRPVDPATRAHLCKPCIRAGGRGAVPEGPCAVCGLADLRVLAVVQLGDGSAVLCANHKALLGPCVSTIDELRREADLGAEAA